MYSNAIFKYIKGEIELALIDNSSSRNFIWKFLQDVTDNDIIVRKETFKYSDHYGILRKDEEDKSFLKFDGETWYLTTKDDCTPVLSNQNPLYSNKINSRYVILQEIYKGVLDNSALDEISLKQLEVFK